MKMFIFLLLSAGTHFHSFACTTFLLNKNGKLVFGRNYDWVSGAGIVYTNQRGLFKTSFLSGEKPSINWVSSYGSITFNQYGKEFPTGGMNDEGLVVELMWLDETRYPQKDKRAALDVLQWIQYQLDNCASVKEVIATDHWLRIETTDTPLHYLVADAAGNAATIEFLDGRMVVHRDENLPFPVLTNSTYEASSAAAQGFFQNNQQPPDDNSLQRFVKVCRMLDKATLAQIKIPLTAYAFSILENVSQGDFTKWSIVYDITNKTILFKTAGNANTRSVSFAAFAFSCVQKAKMYELDQPGKGDISYRFTLPNKNIQRRLLELAIRESSTHVQVGEASKVRMLNYGDTIRCKQAPTIPASL